jgi:glycine/D-amino acid oxidase-like deaminating enzyme
MSAPWRTERNLQSNVAIIGAGIVGLSTALFLKRKYPKLRISVIEKGALPSGASVKNAGFACFGSPTEILSDLDSMGWDSTHDLIRERFLGFKLLKDTLGPEGLDYLKTEASELYLPEHGALYQRSLDMLPDLDRIFESATGQKRNFKVLKDPGGAYGFRGFIGEIAISNEGQIDPGLMMNSLLNLVEEAGVVMYFNSALNQIHEDEGFRLKGTDWSMKADQVILCTNGYTSHLKNFFNVDIIPGRTQVLVTEVLEGMHWKRNFHIDQGYFYLRNHAGRLLFGGGRKLDLQGENTDQEGLSPLIQDRLEEWLYRHFTPERIPRITHRWSGILGLGKEKTPICKEVAPGLYVATRLGGMGIALGMALGRRMAETVFEPV